MTGQREPDPWNALAVLAVVLFGGLAILILLGLL